MATPGTTRTEIRRPTYERAPHDWYVEPRWAVDALLNAETFAGLVWDPACGEGTILRCCEARGLQCVGSDVINRGWPGTVVTDFLHEPPAFAAENIICNPPYGVAPQFVGKAIGLCLRKTAMLLRLAFLESESRKNFFATSPLRRVLVFTKRVSMPPGGKNIEPRGGTKAFAWFVWEHGHEGPPTLGWLP